MMKIIIFLFRLFISLFNKSIVEIIEMYVIVRKENEILKRQLKTRVRFNWSDRLFYSTFIKLCNRSKDLITLVKPETILKWYQNLIKKFWTYSNESSKPGRPSTPQWIKNLILSIKNNNLLWGVKKIQGELLKLNIKLDTKTIWKIIQDFRKKGKLKIGLTWSKFIKSHLNSLYSMDFFTVDTIFNQRFYVHFIICYKTREIVQFAITSNPVKEFVRQQIIDFSENLSEVVYLIHDRAGEFRLNYLDYGIQGITTSVKSPNMNSIAERWIRSIRQEALDYFIIFNEKQLKNIIREYINYYNCQRPHQGIDQAIPNGSISRQCGKIKSTPILSGLHHHYFREAA